jgi:hypothetical protein
MPHHPTYPPKLGRDPTPLESEQFQFLLGFIDYVEKQRPAWMRDLGDGEVGFIIDGHPTLPTSGLCEIVIQDWWGEPREWPRIYIRRPERQDTAGPAVDETCILAHEFGHYRSYQKIGFAEYDRCLKCRLAAEKETDGYKKLSDADRRMVWNEEVEAWALGRTDLEANGFTWWADFERIKESCLETYRVGLGVTAPSQ